MNSTVPGAFAALESAFSELLAASPLGFEAFESQAKTIALSCCVEAMGKALKTRDRELLAQLPKGSLIHSRRPRTLVTLSGDVHFKRTLRPSAHRACIAWYRRRVPIRQRPHAPCAFQRSRAFSTPFIYFALSAASPPRR